MMKETSLSTTISPKAMAKVTEGDLDKNDPSSKTSSRSITADYNSTNPWSGTGNNRRSKPSPQR